MSINHLSTAAELIDINVKSLSIEGTKIGVDSVNVDTSTASLDLTGIKTVYLDTGAGATISGVTGATDGQSVIFMCNQQASTLTIEDGFQLNTPSAADIVLTGVGGCAIGVWSEALSHMTVVKVSA